MGGGGGVSTTEREQLTSFNVYNTYCIVVIC